MIFAKSFILQQSCTFFINKYHISRNVIIYYAFSSV